MKERLEIISIVCAVLAIIALPHRSATTAVEHASLFRHTGDGVISLYNTHSRERLTIRYRDRDGRYDDDALTRLDDFLACPTAGEWESHPMSLKLIELVDNIQDHFKVPQIRVISGYRSPEYNAKLRRRSRRVAKQSMHMRGRAMDIKIPGVNNRTLRNYAASLEAGGVGYYGRRAFVHVDSGPVRTW